MDALLARSGDYPLMAELGYVVDDLAKDACIMRAPINPQHNGIFGSFHGGLMGVAADTAGCFAALTGLKPDSRLATADMTIRYMAPCRTDLICRARVVKRAGKAIHTTVDLLDTDEELCGTAQVTYIRV